jgi:hypothetical protein
MMNLVKYCSTRGLVAVWQMSGRTMIGNVSQTDSAVLHSARVDEIMKWTQQT